MYDRSLPGKSRGRTEASSECRNTLQRREPITTKPKPEPKPSLLILTFPSYHVSLLAFLISLLILIPSYRYLFVVVLSLTPIIFIRQIISPVLRYLLPSHPLPQPVISCHLISSNTFFLLTPLILSHMYYTHIFLSLSLCFDLCHQFGAFSTIWSNLNGYFGR